MRYSYEVGRATEEHQQDGIILRNAVDLGLFYYECSKPFTQASQMLI